VSIVLELDGGVSPAEVVWKGLYLVHELVLPHFVFAAKPNQDERTVVKRLMKRPYVVTAAYYPQTAAFWCPGTAEEEVAKFERGLRQVCTRGDHLRPAH
jgi:predicted cobalt transporter CbtA